MKVRKVNKQHEIEKLRELMESQEDRIYVKYGDKIKPFDKHICN